MAKPRPSVILIAGPNGAGKTTVALSLLKGTLGVDEFVNADVIAAGLSAFNPDQAAITAGRIMLERLHELADKRANFAFETTLASRSFAPWIKTLVSSGYQFHVVFLWLPSDDLAVIRVDRRVQTGGHGVPEESVRRRYRRGLWNFFNLYRPMATTWRFYDSSQARRPQLLASGGNGRRERIMKKTLWNIIVTGLADET